MRETFDCIIVGGGMGGLALALGLARKGRSVVVVERQTELTAIRRGELLQPNGLRILNDLGILNALKDVPFHQANEFHFHRVDQGRLCTVDYRRLPPPWNYTLILRPHFLLIEFLNQIAQTKKVKVLTGTEFDDLIWQGDAVIGVQVSEPGRRRELYASIVVGADGARSRVREALRIPARVHSYPESYITMLVPRTQGFDLDARYYVGNGEILGMFPLSEKELYLFYMIPAKKLAGMKTKALKPILERLIHIHGLLEKPLESITSWEQVGKMPCFRVRADRWVEDGSVLMGDAAHAMNPHVAQGRNQALEDATLLMDLIDEALIKKDFSAGRFKSYEKERRPMVEALQKQADEMCLFWNTGFGPMMWLRDRVFRGMDRNLRLQLKVLEMTGGLSEKSFTVLDRLAAAGLIPRFLGYN